MNRLAIAFCVTLSTPASAFAEISLRPYLGASFESLSTSIDSVKFRNNRILLHSGLWISEGVGLEAELGQDISGDEQYSLTLEYDSYVRYGIRLMSPANAANISLYVLLSRVSSAIKMENQVSSQKITEKVSGYHGGIGVVKKINDSLQIDMSYNGYNFHEKFDISGVRLNVEYTFGSISR